MNFPLIWDVSCKIRKVSKPKDLLLKLFYRSEIWQPHLSNDYRGSESLRDLRN